jgi:hypothetical protein
LVRTALRPAWRETTVHQAPKVKSGDIGKAEIGWFVTRIQNTQGSVLDQQVLDGHVGPSHHDDARGLGDSLAAVAARCNQLRGARVRRRVNPNACS